LASEVTNLSGYQTKASNQFAHRNLVINGDMQIAQRGTSVASITTEGYRTADRWNFTPVSLGTWTQTVENDAPTGSGFRKSLKVLCTTADASPAASDVLRFDYRMEGQNLQQIKKGTAAAEQLTLSFWVKANVTGTYIIGLYDYDNTRYVAKSYTVNASATWEYKTITFPADTTGALDNDNATSLEIEFGLATGTDRSSGTLATTWQSYTAANALVGQVNLASATNNYWQITGVQLEVGDTATPFEFLPAQQELAECQRYYYRMPAGESYQQFGVSYTNSTSAFQAFTITPVTMRAVPTSIDTGGTLSHLQFSNGVDYTLSSIAIGSGQLGTNVIRFSGAVSGATAGNPGWIRANNSTSAFIGFSAEL
jgi:hypothetical protein